MPRPGACTRLRLPPRHRDAGAGCRGAWPQAGCPGPVEAAREDPRRNGPRHTTERPPPPDGTGPARRPDAPRGRLPGPQEAAKSGRGAILWAPSFTVSIIFRNFTTAFTPRRHCARSRAGGGGATAETTENRKT